MDKNKEELNDFEKDFLTKIRNKTDEDFSNDCDEKAKQEVQTLGLEEKRNNEKQQTWHRIVIWGLRIIAVSLAIIFVVRVCHMITPTSWGWLTEEQIKSLNDIIFGGLVGTIIGRRIDQILSNSN